MFIDSNNGIVGLNKYNNSLAIGTYSIGSTSSGTGSIVGTSGKSRNINPGTFKTAVSIGGNSTKGASSGSFNN
jgi:hypothetical protein